jgi:hypothetical protein
MDAWSERQIKAMLLGGNAKLNDFLRQYNADKLPIVKVSQQT